MQTRSFRGARWGTLCLRRPDAFCAPSTARQPRDTRAATSSPGNLLRASFQSCLPAWSSCREQMLHCKKMLRKRDRVGVRLKKPRPHDGNFCHEPEQPFRIGIMHMLTCFSSYLGSPDASTAPALQPRHKDRGCSRPKHPVLSSASIKEKSKTGGRMTSRLVRRFNFGQFRRSRASRLQCRTTFGSCGHSGCALQASEPSWLGSRLIKATIRGRQQGKRTRDSFGPVCRIEWRCA
jgi:hypothetical protein